MLQSTRVQTACSEGSCRPTVRDVYGSGLGQAPVALLKLRVHVLLLLKVGVHARGVPRATALRPVGRECVLLRRVRLPVRIPLLLVLLADLRQLLNLPCLQWGTSCGARACAAARRVCKAIRSLVLVSWRQGGGLCTRAAPATSAKPKKPVPPRSSTGHRPRVSSAACGSPAKAT